MSEPRWRQGGLADLDIEDGAALAALPFVPWAALRQAVASVTFCWPADVDAMPSAWEDLTRQSNLLNWHPGDRHELLRGPVVGADELCHLAVHKLIYRALGRPEGWRSWLFAEAAASATDVLVLGSLLAARREAAFVALQIEVWSTCWEDAGRDATDLQATLADLAADPVAAWREIVALIEAHVSEQRALTDVRASAAAFAERVATPWGPLLLHFQTAWWVGALRAPARAGDQAEALAPLRQQLMAAADPLASLVQRCADT